MTISKIGIIGQGFVGTAVREGLKNHFAIESYDHEQSKSTCASLKELISLVDIMFLCLPTPMLKSGECDISIVDKTICKINNYGKQKTIILKSTVPPGTTKLLNNKYKNVNVIFNPEFLTEANFINDFKNQQRIIIGSCNTKTPSVTNIFKTVFPEVPIINTSSTVAECVKYYTNTFLSTKVSFANEFKQLCDKINVDYNKVVEYSLYDGRIGKTHLSVPGPDGNLGFGGSCFPKDVNALIYYMKKTGITPTVLSAVWDKNLEVRPQKDWENLIGRAVSTKE